MKKTVLLSLSILLSLSHLDAQQTVGVFQNDSLSVNGYTLFGKSLTTYLIDNCGFVVNSWESGFTSNSAMYLLENGNLLRTCRVGGNFSGGGIAGRIEMHNWEGELVWFYNYATPEYHLHHDIEMLPNGNILIFDNGIYRTHDWLTHSKVLEINPKTKEVVWEYADEPWWDFYSPTVSGAQRLPNGNTLITEGTSGRMFQVTPDGQVVWEYVCPFFNINPRDWEVNMVFRGKHYMAEELPQL